MKIILAVSYLFPISLSYSYAYVCILVTDEGRRCLPKYLNKYKEKEEDYVQLRESLTIMLYERGVYTTSCYLDI